MLNFELLAPAGNFDCLIAAVQNGADAIYISGKSFGARSFANNFDHEELVQAMDYCHLRGVKVYVTVNTLIADDELEEVEKYLIFLNNIGTDAIIVQDLGVAELAKRVTPELPIHASTQMTIHNSEGVKALEEMGIKRVVLARELSVAEISKISKATNAELEVFVHGALCMCYSGQCLMSSIIGGRSGNRGKCAQPCRLPYSVNAEKKSAFYMSLRDLCALENLEELKKAGAVSLKIEGRMKGAAYVAAVVKTYRKYIDNPHGVENEDIDLLNKIFNRGGLTNGYIIGKTGKNMFATDKPDNPYRKNENDIIEKLLEYKNEEKIKLGLNCDVVIKDGEYPKIKFYCGNIEIIYIYEKLVEKARKMSLTEETVKTQLLKTGGTPFEIKKMSIELDDNVFLPASDLNALRRNGLALFQEKYLSQFKREQSLKETKTEEKVAFDGNLIGYSCEVTNFEQLKSTINMPFNRFLIPFHIINENVGFVEKIKDKTVIVLPSIIHEAEYMDLCSKTEEFLENGFKGVLLQNISLIDRFKKGEIYAGFRMNIFNSETLRNLFKRGVAVAELSPELTLRQISKIKKYIPVQTMVYGRLPLMISENCVIRNGDNCPCKDENVIIDRKGMRFPVIKDGKSCRSIVLNCKKTYMATETKRILGAGVNLLRLYFTDEDYEECQRVCRAYLYGESYRPEDFTTAHYNKGVMQG